MSCIKKEKMGDYSSSPQAVSLSIMWRCLMYISNYMVLYYFGKYKIWSHRLLTNEYEEYQKCDKFGKKLLI